MKSLLCRIELDERNQEITAMGNALFPIQAFFNDLDQMPTKEIPWHWHEQIELIYMQQGSANIQVQQDQFILEEHMGLFINTNMLHSISKVQDSCIFYSFVCSPTFICDNPTSLIYLNYVQPLLQSKHIPYIQLCSNHMWQSEAIHHMYSSFELYESAMYGYELLIREHFTHLWYLLVTNHDITHHINAQESSDSKRIKQMINYIHTSYKNSISLACISQSANISTREALRCFHNTLHCSPITFLLQHRVASATILLQNTNLTITEIAQSCGFENSSYFTRVFKRFMGLTPTYYRSQHKSSDL